MSTNKTNKSLEGRTALKTKQFVHFDLKKRQRTNLEIKSNEAICGCPYPLLKSWPVFVLYVVSLYCWPISKKLLLLTWNNYTALFFVLYELLISNDAKSELFPSYLKKKYQNFPKNIWKTYVLTVWHWQMICILYLPTFFPRIPTYSIYVF